MNSKALKPEAFDTHLANKTLRLAFVGMSNAGKTYRSRALNNELGFTWYEVDKAIGQALGLDSIEKISGWLGYPSSEGYPERERRYLELENEFTKKASMRSEGRNFVFDTTGSVVHLESETHQVLQKNCLVIHLEITKDKMARMLEKFFEEPKPVAWAGFYAPKPGETTEETIRRCYPELLKARLVKYRDISHISIPVPEIRDTSAEQTLAIIKSHV